MAILSLEFRLVALGSSPVIIGSMDLIKTKTFKQFKIIEYEIGRGTTGRVLLGQWLVEPKQYVAVKEINIKLIEKDEVKMKQIANEINSLRSLESPYIVKLYGSVQTDNNLYMFLEYCEDGDLRSYIDKRHGSLTESEALIFFRHIVEGYKQLNKNNIIHRDIKPANILLKQNTAKISDFGFSRVLDNADQSAMMTLLGTPLYTAPEILNGQKFEAKCDVWSLGVVLYEMLYGKTPWTGTKLEELRKNIETTELVFGVPQRSDAVKNLLRRMLDKDPKSRISWKEIFVHPLVRDELTIKPPPKASYEDIVAIFICYLKQNVVAGYLNINVQAVQAVEESCNLKAYGPEMQFSQLAAYREKMLKIFIQIMWERNIAFFLNYVLGLVYRFKESLPKRFNANAQFEYVIAKLALNSIEKIERRFLTNFKIEYLPEATVDDWQQFKMTSEYKSISEMIKNDRNILFELLEVIKARVKNIYIDNKGGQRIARYLDKMEGEYWSQIVQAVLSDNLMVLGKEKNPSKVSMLLKQYIRIAASPQAHFNTPGFDFHRFYEKNEETYGLI